MGTFSFGEKEVLVFLGKEVGEQRNYSERVAAEIDEEVSNFIRNAQATAQKILKQRRVLLDKIAKALFEKETIEREEFEKIIKLRKEPKASADKSKKFSVKRIK